MEGLIDVFSHADLFRVDTRPNASWGSVREGTPILFESARFNGSPGRRLGEPAIVDFATFKSLFNAAAAGVLQQVDWRNCMVAGGQVLGCLRGLAKDIEKPSDIDIFLFALEGPGQILWKVHTLLFQIYQGYEIANRCNPVTRPDVFIEVFRTEHTLTLIPRYDVPVEGGFLSLPKIQIVMRNFLSAADVLAPFDLDCCCVAYDGTRVWASPRALRALQTGINLVGLSFRHVYYEDRLMKYSRRGFAVQDPEMSEKPLALLERYFGRQQESIERLGLEDLVRCIRASKGLLKLLLADLAEKRGIVWASALVETASFDVTNPEEGFEEQHGNSASNDSRPVVFHPPPLLKFWKDHYPNLFLKDLLRYLGRGDTDRLDFDFYSNRPPVNPSRADWERGITENSLEDAVALLSLTAPKSSSQDRQAQAPSLQKEVIKKQKTSETRTLLELPNIVLVEVLNHCTAKSLAALAITCKTLERAVVLGGVWKHLCFRDFSPQPVSYSSDRPGFDLPPQAWSLAYRDLTSLKNLGWREWDVSPLRAQAERCRGNMALFARNAPFPRVWHATAVCRNKLVLTGGIKHSVGIEGTFVFDFDSKEWTKVRTKLRQRCAVAQPGDDPFESVDWDFSSRQGHTMTAINGHEIVVLFGKRGLSAAEKARVESAGEAREQQYVPVNDPRIDVSNLLDAISAGQDEELDAIYARQPHGGGGGRGVSPVLRKGHTACLHPDGKSVIVFGGLTSDKGRFEESTERECVSTADLHVLDQETRDGERVWVWKEVNTTGGAPHSQHGHGACVVGDRLVILGGYIANETWGDWRDHPGMKVWILDLKSLEWSHPQPSSPPELRSYFGSLVAFGDNVVMIEGGHKIWMFNMRDSTWGKVKIRNHCLVKSFNSDKKVFYGRSPVVRVGHSVAQFGFSVYVMGGNAESNIFEQMAVLDLAGFEHRPR
ncbi:hypothetical protein KFL_005580050 [Klebsormidium nitens]|uniref:F-box domain-containing protein n=1 Tax=Klebsormidium nitens TaxID=105231 RepID=A0A0U9HKM0_KLENI|nr:hypothetical protein KFL_005580050 [Klebsormidium nitens]|eukprot:GAQ89753.1 hypothetical protein KFL_005580050 [Klebsormidium nitens]